MDGYNGWTNYETFATAKWLEKYIDSEIDDVTPEHLQQTVENMMEDLPPMWGLFRDLLSTSLNNVNWIEISAAANLR
jgi:hypothetical protein